MTGEVRRLHVPELVADQPCELALAAEAIRNYPKFTARGVALDDLTSPTARLVIETCTAVWEAGDQVNMTSVSLELQRIGRVQTVGGMKGLADLSTSESVPDHGRIKALAMLRRLREAGAEVMRAAGEGDLPKAVEALQNAERAALGGDSVSRVRSAHEAVAAVFTGLMDQAKAAKTRVHPGLGNLHQAIGYLPVGGCMVVGADTNVGKALRSTEPVLTPGGWTPIGDLNVGDKVIASDGTVTDVTGVYPQGERELFTVTFDDGTSIDADANHRWSVGTDNDNTRGNAWRVMTTAQLMEGGIRDSMDRLRWRTPVVKPIRHAALDLPIDPYLLGVLLGDGCFSDHGIGLSKKGDPEVLERCARGLPAGIAIRRQAGATGERGGFRLTGERTGGRPNPLIESLRGVGLMGHGSHEKFIPAEYLLGSIEQRLSLMQGLLDTDGTVGKDGRHLSYCSTSKRLMDGFVEIVHSLGGTSRITTKTPTYTHNGERRTGRLAYTANICLPEDIKPFFCERKAARFVPRTCRRPTRKIVAIQPTTPGDATCITVAHESHLFVTRGYVLTHNSSFVLEMLIECAGAGTKCGLISVEDPNEVTGARLLGAFSGVSSRNLQRGKFGEAEKPALEGAMQKIKKLGDSIMVADCTGETDLEVCAAMSQMAARGAKLVVVDYIGEVESSKKQQDRRNEIRWVCRRLKTHARRLGLALVVVSQLSRPTDKQTGKRPSKHDLKESGDITNSAEVIVMLWRDTESDSAPVKAWIAKCKWGGVGQWWEMKREQGTGRLRESGVVQTELPSEPKGGRRERGF
jgi:replicative DNA helicase